MEQSFHDSLPDWPSFLRSQLPEREREREAVCQLCGPRTIKFQPVGEVEESVRCSTSTWRPHVPRNLQRDPFGMTFRYALPQSRSRLARALSCRKKMEFPPGVTRTCLAPSFRVILVPWYFISAFPFSNICRSIPSYFIISEENEETCVEIIGKKKISRVFFLKKALNNRLNSRNR